MVLFPVDVGQFRQAQPLIRLNILDVVLNQGHHSLLFQHFSLELNLGRNVVAIQPYPLWAIVVAVAVGHQGVMRVITVIVVGHEHRVHFSQSAHSD